MPVCLYVCTSYCKYTYWINIYIICARIYGPGFHQTPHTSLATSQPHEVKEAITYVGSWESSSTQWLLPCARMRETGLTNQSVLPVCLSVCPLQSYSVQVKRLLNATITLDSPKKPLYTCGDQSSSILAMYPALSYWTSVGSEIQKYGRTRTLACVHNKEVCGEGIPWIHSL